MKVFRLILFLLITISFTFLAVACEDPISIPSTKEEAVLKLETAGYEITEITIEEEGVLSAFTAYRENDAGYSGIMVIWFENETFAEEYEKDWVDSRYQVKKKQGAILYYGTKTAINDFEKA